MSHPRFARMALSERSESKGPTKGGGGSGGLTWQTYMSALGATPDAQVVYPATVTLRVPATLEDEIVRYGFTDLDLAKVPSAR